MQGTATSSTVGGNGSGTINREAATQMGEKAHAGLDRITQSAHHTIDRVTAAAGSAAERLSEGRLASTAQEWHGATTAYVRQHPLTAIGIAVAAGFLLSRLTSLR